MTFIGLQDGDCGRVLLVGVGLDEVEMRVDDGY